MPTKATLARIAASKAKSEAAYKPTVAKPRVQAKKLPARATRKQAVYKYESEEESEEEPEAEDDYDYGFGEVEVVAVEKKPVFTEFEADEELEEGLCIVRSLGGGKYELVNLNTVPRALLGSEQTGDMIKGNDERRAMFTIDKEQWEEVIVKTELAAKSADGHIFRLMNLPLELRYKIYEFAVIANVPIHPTEAPSKALGLGLLRASRQIYREAIPFFRRNNFKITDVIKRFDQYRESVIKNVQEITFDWWGFSRKDTATLALFNECKKLKVLHVVVTQWSVDPSPYHKRQLLFQDDLSIKRFSRTNGFDALLAIRGLQKVTVQNSKIHKAPGLSDEELAAFEAVLMRELTQPKPAKTSKKRKERD
ncbi:hypothetical protein N431DRAFT_546473 [Stipitochalara longipes BDJ]|nr:hypothetical protein N431DRAFT_546473 [Stipitochalara longipes BDJ]